MAGSDPAGRPLRARLGHRQRPQGPTSYCPPRLSAAHDRQLPPARPRALLRRRPFPSYTMHLSSRSVTALEPQQCDVAVVLTTPM